METYNNVNPIKETKTVTFSTDTYTLEHREFGYDVLINGKKNKTYSRLPKDLREFFNL